MIEKRTDIVERRDIEILVDRFYEKVNQNALLGPLFSHVNWEKHLPTMYQFWSSMILGEQSYRGNPFQKHVTLPLDASHFQQWLNLFVETVDELFAGEKAEEIKMRAANIAGVFKYRMNLS
jgi:hemoglobin